MGQVFMKYWTSVSKKPKNFKKNCYNSYTYDIVIKNYTDNLNYDYYIETLNIPYYYDMNETNINMEILILRFKKIFKVNINESNIETGYFKRDGHYFNIVEIINIPYGDRNIFKENIFLKRRKTKINNIIDKIN